MAGWQVGRTRDLEHLGSGGQLSLTDHPLRVGEWKVRKKVEEGKSLAGCPAGKEHVITQTLKDTQESSSTSVSFYPLSPGHSGFKPDSLKKIFSNKNIVCYSVQISPL